MNKSYANFLQFSMIVPFLFFDEKSLVRLRSPADLPLFEQIDGTAPRIGVSDFIVHGAGHFFCKLLFGCSVKFYAILCAI